MEYKTNVVVSCIKTHIFDHLNKVFELNLQARWNNSLTFLLANDWHFLKKFREFMCVTFIVEYTFSSNLQGKLLQLTLNDVKRILDLGGLRLKVYLHLVGIRWFKRFPSDWPI